MQKIILDTNVLVSALIRQGIPYLILRELYLERVIKLCVSENLMSEYYEVLNRSKFSKFPEFKAKADSVLTDIANRAAIFYPKKKVKIIRDADDNMLLELAFECKADFLITGNTNDFTISTYKKTRIVTPREYWDIYRPI